MSLGYHDGTSPSILESLYSVSIPCSLSGEYQVAIPHLCAIPTRAEQAHTRTRLCPWVSELSTS